MRIDFTKMHGAGNDFIVINSLARKIEITPEQVTALCDRHFGIGADGIILVRPSQNPDCVAYMHYMNADGSLAQMCGNGVRCFAKFLVDNGLVQTGSGSLIADTMAGPKLITLELDAKRKLQYATVDMGEPAFAPDLIPTTLQATREITITDATDVANARSQHRQHLEPAVVQAVISGTRDTKNIKSNIPLTCVNMGNPHAVVFLEYLDAATAQAFLQNPSGFDLDSLGGFLEGNTQFFPQRINAEFAALAGPNRIKMRVYERGIGETMACGTGACATAVAAVILDSVDRNQTIAVELPGGTLEINWLPNNHIQMRGPAIAVFEGSIEI